MPMVSLQLPDDILRKFDQYQQDAGYTSRSEALRDAIIHFLNSKESMKKKTGILRTVISVTYDVNIENKDKFSRIDHTYENMIKTYSEYSLSNKTIRTYLLVGEAERINDFTQAFNKIKDTQTHVMNI